MSVPEGVGWWDKEHEEFASEVLRSYPPGSYLLHAGSAGDAVDKYFKMEKTRWQSLFLHDYFIAFLRRDENAKSMLKEAYGKLAEAFEWPERQPWKRVEENALAEASKAVDAAFNFYVEKLKVDGWRTRAEETLCDAEDRLKYEPSPIGDKYRTEYGRWEYLAELLFNFAKEVKLKDRVALWESIELETRAKLNVYGKALRDSSYLESLLESILAGKEPDRWVDMAFWYTYMALLEIEKHIRMDLPGSLENEDYTVMAVMSVVKQAEPDPNAVEKFVQEFARARGNPKLAATYYTSKFGPSDRSELFWSGNFKMWEEMTDEERKFFLDQRKAGIDMAVEWYNVLTEELQKRKVNFRTTFEVLGDWSGTIFARFQRQV
jgi:hypothetical protein